MYGAWQIVGSGDTAHCAKVWKVTVLGGKNVTYELWYTCITRV